MKLPPARVTILHRILTYHSLSKIKLRPTVTKDVSCTTYLVKWNCEQRITAPRQSDISPYFTQSCSRGSRAELAFVYLYWWQALSSINSLSSRSRIDVRLQPVSLLFGNFQSCEKRIVKNETLESRSLVLCKRQEMLICWKFCWQWCHLPGVLNMNTDLKKNLYYSNSFSNRFRINKCFTEVWSSTNVFVLYNTRW